MGGGAGPPKGLAYQSSCLNSLLKRSVSAFTFGHSLNKTLKNAGITTDFKGWSEQAQDRGAWRTLIHSRVEYPTPHT